MVVLISRQNAFLMNPVLARYVYDFQKSSFDPLAEVFVPGEKVYISLEDEVPQTLTVEQAKQLNAEYAAECARLSDQFAPVPEPLDFQGLVIGEVEAADFHGFARKVGGCLDRLTEVMGWGELALLPISKVPFLFQDNDYEPVARASEMLKEAGIEADYSGGVVLSSQDMGSFLEALFWIVRCNAAAPYFCFAGAKSSLVGVLCKYGNIHFECYEHSEKQRLVEQLAHAGFVVSVDGICEERFSESGAIKGRRLPLA